MSLLCNHCHTRLKSTALLPGTRAKCPRCGNVMTVPAAGSSPDRPSSAITSRPDRFAGSVPVAAGYAAPPEERSGRSGLPFALIGGLTVCGLLLLLVVGI